MKRFSVTSKGGEGDLYDVMIVKYGAKLHHVLSYAIKFAFRCSSFYKVSMPLVQTALE